MMVSASDAKDPSASPCGSSLQQEEAVAEAAACSHASTQSPLSYGDVTRWWANTCCRLPWQVQPYCAGDAIAEHAYMTVRERGEEPWGIARGGRNIK